MTFLLDTQLLLWTVSNPKRLSERAFAITQSDSNHFLFSTISVWEVAIKFTKHQHTFPVDPVQFRTGLISSNFSEMLLRNEHVIATASLPLLHGDPFDRLLIAQAMVEGVQLVTADRTLAQYGESVLFVG